MKIRIDPIIATARFYLEKINDQSPLHVMQEHYYKTLTIIYLDNGYVRFTACTEAPTIKELKFLIKKLFAMGSKNISWRHHGKEVSISDHKK